MKLQADETCRIMSHTYKWPILATFTIVCDIGPKSCVCMTTFSLLPIWLLHFIITLIVINLIWSLSITLFQNNNAQMASELRGSAPYNATAKPLLRDHQGGWRQTCPLPCVRVQDRFSYHSQHLKMWELDKMHSSKSSQAFTIHAVCVWRTDLDACYVKEHMSGSLYCENFGRTYIFYSMSCLRSFS